MYLDRYSISESDLRNVIPYPKRNTPTTFIGLEDFVFETCGGDHPLSKIITPGRHLRNSPNQTKPNKATDPHTTEQSGQPPAPPHNAPNTPPLTIIQRTMTTTQTLTQHTSDNQSKTKQQPATTPGTLSPYPDHQPHNAVMIPRQPPAPKRTNNRHNLSKSE